MWQHSKKKNIDFSLNLSTRKKGENLFKVQNSNVNRVRKFANLYSHFYQSLFISLKKKKCKCVIILIWKEPNIKKIIKYQFLVCVPEMDILLLQNHQQCLASQ